MKNTKFIKRAVSSFLAAAMIASLASCDAKLPGSKGGNIANQPRQIVNYYTSEMFEKPDELGYISNIFSVGEKLYVFGDKNSDTAEKLSGSIDLSDNSFAEMDMSFIECEYLMRSMSLGDKLVVSYVTKDNYEYVIALVDPEKKSVITEKKLSQNSYPMSMSVNSNGNLNVTEQNFGPGASTLFVKEYDINTLEEKSSLKMNDIIETTNNEEISEVAFDNDGAMYVSVIKYDNSFENIESKVVKVTADHKIAYTIDNLSDLEGSATVMRRANGNMCILSSKDYSNFYFNEINNETGDVTGRYEAKLGDVRGIVTNCDIEGTDIIYSNSDGIYTLNIENQKSEKKYSFGKEIPEKYKECYDLSYNGGKLYIYGESYGDSRQQFCILDNEGNLIDTVALEQGSDEYINDMGVTPEGNICFLNESYKTDEDGNGNTCYSLKVLNESGEVISETDLSEISGGINTYVQKFAVAGDGKILVAMSSYTSDGSSSSGLAVLDSSGSLMFKIENEDIQYIENIAATASGDYIFYYDNRGKSLTAKIDYDGMKFGDDAEFDIPVNAEMIDGDGNYDFCYTTSEGMYGYSISEKKSTEILNWVDSDITLDIRNAVFAGSDSILCVGYDYEIGDTQLYMLKRADEETLKKIQNKKIITLAGMNLGYNESFREHVSEFNKTSDEYRIQLNDYSKFTSYEDDTYKSGAFQLNADMAAGNVPDIIIGNSEINMTSFAAKGLLADLNPYFEKDPDLVREDFFENVLDVYSYDGKLCQLVSNFNLSVLVGPKSKLGTEPKMTYDDFFALADKGNVFYNESREWLTDIFINSNLAEFVDFEKKTCDFDNERFTGMVEFIKSQGKVYDEDEENDMYDSGNYTRRFADGKCQLEFSSISGFYDILNLQQGAINEEVSLKGLPAEEGSGYQINSNSSLSICSKSSNKDAAWEFIKGFLTEEYQDGLNEDYSHTFPVRKSSFEKMINKEMTNNDNNRGYSVETQDGDYVEMKPLDKVTADKIRAAVEAADRAAVSDERINNIITEELDEVFADAKSANDAAASIQNKVSLYLKEIK